MITLEDIEEIKQLKARYCRCVDLKRWREFRELFADDCRFDGMATSAGSPDDFVARVESSLKQVRSVHHVHNPEIRSAGDMRARGSWSLQDYLFWKPDATVPPWLRGSERQLSVVGFGLYEEEYVRTPTGWKISRMRLSRLAMMPLLDHSPLLTGEVTLRQVWGEPDAEWLAGGGFRSGRT